MHRNVPPAYDYLKREHDRIRAAHVKILAQKDRHSPRLEANFPTAGFAGFSI